jgi:predicted RNA binding protein YcfA (HicA-like mRNA interferase family)
MMPKLHHSYMRLVPISRSDLVKRLRAFGWEGPFAGAKHPHMVKGDILLTIPNPHGSKEIGVNLLVQILAQAEISRAEWLKQK